MSQREESPDQFAPGVRSVWVVIGEQGEFSDFSCWDVAVYLDKELAQLHANRANQYAVNLRKQYRDADPGERDDTLINPFDPERGYQGYERRRYSVEKLILSDHPDEFQDVVAQNIAHRKAQEEKAKARMKSPRQVREAMKPDPRRE